MLDTEPLNTNRLASFLINTLDILLGGANTQTAFGAGTSLGPGCLTQIK